MDGLPVTIRLIDPPLHEFLPDYTDLSVETALMDERGERDTKQHQLLDAVKRLHEENPMLGLRGVRLGIVIPGLFAMQARAILEAAARRIKDGGDPQPEIMIPLVATVQELELVRADILEVADAIEEETGVRPDFKVGTMIELPRAVMAAGEIAGAAEFFSFGTNDLTQMTWGFSRDDVEASFFSTYLEKGVFGVSPFESLDTEGVGALVEHAVEAGPRRAPRPAPRACAASTAVTRTRSTSSTRSGLDYVSCSPFRVPVARLRPGARPRTPAEAAGERASERRSRRSSWRGLPISLTARAPKARAQSTSATLVGSLLRHCRGTRSVFSSHSRVTDRKGMKNAPRTP